MVFFFMLLLCWLVCDNLIRASFDQSCVFPDVAACLPGDEREDGSVFLCGKRGCGF